MFHNNSKILLWVHIMWSEWSLNGKTPIIRGVDNFFDVGGGGGGLTSSHVSGHACAHDTSRVHAICIIQLHS